MQQLTSEKAFNIATSLYAKTLESISKEAAKVGSPVHDGNTTDKMKRLLKRIEILSQIKDAN